MPKLQSLKLDTVKRAADLASEAVGDRQRFVAGMRNIDLGEQLAERGSRNPTDLDTLNVVSTDASAALDQLKGLLSGLSPDERIELRAVMMVGRGDYAGNQWDEALLNAGSAPDATSYDDIAEKIELHDFLMKGLFALGMMEKAGK
ncbi:DUF3775 domain-containing protein [Azospirillum sp.]|uniref:DUF3775 domain-containing protein n=1 Tax=Azospirillum sp. TaxID=34012 RepID=UPI003D70B56D